MDFPTRDTSDRNDAKPSLGAVTITAPADNPAASAEDRRVAQQWRDLNATGNDTAKVFPLSLNRDAAPIGNANDPYTS